MHSKAVDHGPGGYGRIYPLVERAHRPGLAEVVQPLSLRQLIANVAPGELKLGPIVRIPWGH